MSWYTPPFNFKLSEEVPRPNRIQPISPMITKLVSKVWTEQEVAQFKKENPGVDVYYNESTSGHIVYYPPAYKDLNKYKYDELSGFWLPIIKDPISDKP